MYYSHDVAVPADELDEVVARCLAYGLGHAQRVAQDEVVATTHHGEGMAIDVQDE
jgi:hypothetical protein